MAINGSHDGLGVVSRLPSSAARRIAVTGRQKPNRYFVSQATMRASAIAIFKRANNRALSFSERLWRVIGRVRSY